MGAWAAGPFDNDDAADWANTLDDAEPHERPAVVAAALSAAADEAGYLDMSDAEAAFAAAAVVAAARAGVTLESAYAPQHSVDADDELVALALRALDRIAADESEWRELWEDADGAEKAMAELAEVRGALEAVDGG